jgi:ferredoxin
MALNRRGSGIRVVVNPIACDGHGMCAELLPEMIRLDDWGYPVIDPSPVPYHLEPHLRRAISACPTLALLARRIEDQKS